MYDLSECTIRIPNTSVPRFNSDYMYVENYGIGRTSYRTEVTVEPEAFRGREDVEYNKGTVEFEAISDMDAYALVWSTEDIVSHKQFKYKQDSDYSGEKMIFGLSLPQKLNTDYREVGKYMRFQIDYANGRSYRIRADKYYKYAATPWYQGDLFALDFDNLISTDINGVEYTTRPSGITRVKTIVYPDSYGTGKRTFIYGWEKSEASGYVSKILIGNYNNYPNSLGNVEYYEQTVGVSEIEETELIDIYGQKLLWIHFDEPVLSHTQYILQDFLYHPSFPSAIETSKYNMGYYYETAGQPSNNFFMIQKPKTLDAFIPQTPIGEPLGITLDFDKLNNRSPKLLLEQAALLNGSGRVVVRMGGENWQETIGSLDATAGYAKKQVSRIVDGFGTKGVNEQFRQWVVSVYNQDAVSGIDIGITNANPVGAYGADSQMQADADGNITNFYSTPFGADLLKLALNEIRVYMIDETGATDTSGIVYDVMLEYNDSDGYLNIYDQTTIDEYFTATGNTPPAPYLRNVYDVTPQQIIDNADYFAWLNSSLGAMVEKIVEDFPLILKTISVNVPRVKNPDIPVLEPINDAAAYDSPNFGYMAINSSQHILNGDEQKVHDDLHFLTDHGYIDAGSKYMAGQIPSYSERWRWSRVDDAIDGVEAFYEIKALGLFEAFRDGFVWYGFGDGELSGFVCGGC